MHIQLQAFMNLKNMHHNQQMQGVDQDLTSCNLVWFHVSEIPLRFINNCNISFINNKLHIYTFLRVTVNVTQVFRTERFAVSL